MGNYFSEKNNWDPILDYAITNQTFWIQSKKETTHWIKQYTFNDPNIQNDRERNHQKPQWHLPQSEILKKHLTREHLIIKNAEIMRNLRDTVADETANNLNRIIKTVMTYLFATIKELVFIWCVEL